jgi:hypothetical protein
VIRSIKLKYNKFQSKEAEILQSLEEKVDYSFGMKD